MKYSALGLAGFCSFVGLSVNAVPVPAQYQPPSADIALGHEIFKELIEIDTTQSHSTASLASRIQSGRCLVLGTGRPS